MQFIIKALDGEGMLEKRLEVRHLHFEGIERILDHVICAGAILGEDGKIKGSLLVMEYADRKELDEYLANEIYVKEHVWEKIEVETMTVAILDGEKTGLWPSFPGQAGK